MINAWKEIPILFTQLRVSESLALDKVDDKAFAKAIVVDNAKHRMSAKDKIAANQRLKQDERDKKRSKYHHKRASSEEDLGAPGGSGDEADRLADEEEDRLAEEATKRRREKRKKAADEKKKKMTEDELLAQQLKKDKDYKKGEKAIKEDEKKTVTVRDDFTPEQAARLKAYKDDMSKMTRNDWCYAKAHTWTALERLIALGEPIPITAPPPEMDLPETPPSVAQDPAPLHVAAAPSPVDLMDLFYGGLDQKHDDPAPTPLEPVRLLLPRVEVQEAAAMEAEAELEQEGDKDEPKPPSIFDRFLGRR